MSSALTVVQPSQLQKGGLGIDFGSKLFQLKPATLTINQPNTQVDGAIRGKIRISETGQQFDEMILTLLSMPTEQRAYYTGEPGQLNRVAENKLCFSTDMIRPHKDARMPQAIRCEGCQMASWDKWRQTKRKEDIPPCDAYYYALFCDTVYKMPLQMYIRSKSKGPFEAGMQEVARLITYLQTEGKAPNIFDIRFKLTTKLIKTGSLTSYVLNVSEVRQVEESERAAFGDVYLRYVNRNRRNDEQESQDTAQAEIDAAQDYIEGEIVNAPTDQEITI